jgi:hypothetical protein
MEIKKSLDKYKLLLMKPVVFYKKVAKEKEYMSIALFIAAFAFIGELVEFIMWLPQLMGGTFAGAELWFTLGASVAGVIASPLIVVLVSFISAALVHLGVMYFKGKGDYFITWKVVAYASVISVIYGIFSSVILLVLEFLNPYPEQSLLAAEPTMGVWWIAMIGFSLFVSAVIMIHVVYTETIGISQYHKLSNVQAFVAVVAPLVVIILGLMLIGSLFAGGIALLGF